MNVQTCKCGAVLVCDNPVVADEWYPPSGQNDCPNSPKGHQPVRVKRGVPLHIEGRRWFQRTYGNTYHKTYIYQAGECLAAIGPTYGYGEQFLQTAFEWLRTHGLPEVYEPTKNGGVTNYGTQYLREVLHSTYSVSDVARQKDL